MGIYKNMYKARLLTDGILSFDDIFTWDDDSVGLLSFCLSIHTQHEETTKGRTGIWRSRSRASLSFKARFSFCVYFPWNIFSYIYFVLELPLLLLLLSQLLEKIKCNYATADVYPIKKTGWRDVKSVSSWAAHSSISMKSHLWKGEPLLSSTNQSSLFHW